MDNGIYPPVSEKTWLAGNGNPRSKCKFIAGNIFNKWMFQHAMFDYQRVLQYTMFVSIFRRDELGDPL